MKKGPGLTLGLWSGVDVWELQSLHRVHGQNYGVFHVNQGPGQLHLQAIPWELRRGFGWTEETFC